MNRRVHLCADDYGLNPGVDEGILALVAKARLTAVSALVTTPHWGAASDRIRRSRVLLGLHLNLTEGAPLSPALRQVWPQFPGLGQALAHAGLRRWPQALHAEFDAQLQRFVETTGRAPDFIDGHQHVHALPGVRDWALATGQRLRVPLRNTGRVLGPGFAFKRWVIETCGGRALQRALQARAMAHPTALLGVYDFDARADYRALMQAWLRAAPDGALLFCHPGQASSAANEPADAIAPARQRELAYLASDEFLTDLAEVGVTLVRRA